MDSYGLIWTLRDSYGLLPKVSIILKLASEKNKHIKLIWTLMGSYGMHTERIKFYGLIVNKWV